MTHQPSQHKEFMPDTNSNNNGSPLKRALRISGKTVVIIDDSLVKYFGIDDNEIWFEEEKMNDGIKLKIRRFSNCGR